MKKYIAAIFLIYSLLNVGVATKMPEFDQQNIAVASQAGELRKHAFQQGLKQQLIKLSGNSRIADNPSFAKALADPSPYIKAYSYQGNILNITFQAKTIRCLLRQANLTVWSAERPAVFMWVMVQDEQHNYLLSTENNDMVFAQLKILAQQRGIPLVFPNTELSPELSHLAKLAAAIQLYKHDVVISSQLTRNKDGSWQAQTQLLIEKISQEWQSNGKDAIEVMIDSMNLAFDALAQAYAVNDAAIATSILSLKVTQIDTIDKYANVINYLREFSLVKSITIQKILPTQVQFKLTIIGSESDFKKALSLSNRISAAPSLENEQLIYNWQN